LCPHYRDISSRAVELLESAMGIGSAPYIWPPPRRGVALSIHIPASLVSVEQGIVKKTLIVGLIARASAIFRVDRVAVYRDPGASPSDLELVRKILEYMSTPPYLRKRIIAIDRDLKAVGVLPPLATASHPTEEDIGVDHIRPAMVTRASRGRICLDPGLGGDVCIHVDRSLRYREGDMVFVRVVKGGRVIGLADPGEVSNIYWGYGVEVFNSLRESIESSRGDLYVVSTRKGSHRLEELGAMIRSARDVEVIFGSPEKDPDEIAGEEGWGIESISHYKFNSAPLQGVRSIRTYEAVYITLAMLNSILYRIKQI